VDSRAGFTEKVRQLSFYFDALFDFVCHVAIPSVCCYMKFCLLAANELKKHEFVYIFGHLV